MLNFCFVPSKNERTEFLFIFFFCFDILSHYFLIGKASSHEKALDNLTPKKVKVEEKKESEDNQSEPSDETNTPEETKSEGEENK